MSYSFPTHNYITGLNYSTGTTLFLLFSDSDGGGYLIFYNYNNDQSIC